MLKIGRRFRSVKNNGRVSNSRSKYNFRTFFRKWYTRARIFWYLHPRDGLLVIVGRPVIGPERRS